MRTLVIGGGIIGLEMGTVYSTLGARLDVVEMMDGLMPGADRDLVRVWEKMNKHRFDRMMTKTKTVAVEARSDAVYATFEGEGAPQGPQPYDKVLMSVGRAPNGRKISAEKAGIAVSDRGFIPVDAQMRTNVPHIYAIGDVVGQPMLAHKAEEEGVAVAERIAGQHGHVDFNTVPWVIYTAPEIAWVGKTEQQLKAEGIAYKVGKIPFMANGRALGMGDPTGFVKMLADAATDRILGVHIIGANASELISEAVVAMEFAGCSEDLARICHAHPTLSEAVHEAALACDKRPLHF